MSNWNDLPYEVLQLIFKYLKNDTNIPLFPSKTTMVQLTDILQYQLTCKNWAFLARKHIYNNIYITSTSKLGLLVDTVNNSDVGPLIKRIFIQRELERYGAVNVLIASIRSIATSCTNSKVLHFKADNLKSIWTTVKEERLAGKFTRIESAPFLSNPGNQYLLQYDNTIHCLQESLRELVVYNNNVLDKEKSLWFFPNVNIVFFLIW